MDKSIQKTRKTRIPAAVEEGGKPRKAGALATLLACSLLSLPACDTIINVYNVYPESGVAAYADGAVGQKQKVSKTSAQVNFSKEKYKKGEDIEISSSIKVRFEGYDDSTFDSKFDVYVDGSLIKTVDLGSSDALVVSDGKETFAAAFSGSCEWSEEGTSCSVSPQADLCSPTLPKTVGVAKDVLTIFGSGKIEVDHKLITPFGSIKLLSTGGKDAVLEILNNNGGSIGANSLNASESDVVLLQTDGKTYMIHISWVSSDYVKLSWGECE